MSEQLTSALIQSPAGGLFSTLSVDGAGIVIKNASDDTRSDGTFVPAGSDTLVLSAVGESSFLNASYMKVGVLDASLMRTGLLQTVASWNTKWYGSSADAMDVQQGFSGGKFTPASVSTTSDAITLSDLKSPTGTDHNITTSDYVRVSGLVFDVSGDDLYGNVGVDSPGSGVMDYADVTAVTTNSVTFKYNGIGAGKSTLNKYSIPFISKAVEISSISRVYDDGATDDNPAELSKVTVNTSSAHGLSTGNYVELHGVEDSLNGVWRVSSAPSSTQFTFMQRFVEDLDWENDGSITLPEYGAPVAIEVAKSYRVTSDGTLLAYGAVFNPAGQRRSAILLQGDATQGDIAVPADGTLHIGYRNGTDGLGGSFETIMKINTPATGNQAATTIYGTVTVDVLNATTINGGTAGSAVIPNDLVTQTVQTTSGNVRIRPYENDGSSANKRGEIEWYTQVSSTGAFTSQVMTFSDKDYPGALVVDPDLKVLGDADVVGTLSVGVFEPTVVEAEQVGTDFFQVRSGNILIDPSVSDGPGGQTRGEITFRTWNGAAYTTRGKIYASAGVGTKLAVDSPFRIVDATASTSGSTGALIVDGGAGIGGKLYIGDVTQSTAHTDGAFVVSGGVGIAKDLRVQGKAWFQDVDVANALDIGELNVDSLNIEYNGIRRATIIGSSTSAGQVSMYFNEGLSDLTFYVSGAITTTNNGPITSGGKLTASSTIETTSAVPGSQTGALVVVGGASIGKSLRVNEGLFVTAESSFSNSLSVSGLLTASSFEVTNLISRSGSSLITNGGNLTIGANNTTGVMTAGSLTAFKVDMNSGKTYVQNTEDATATVGTGSLVVTGGLRVGKTTRTQALTVTGAISALGTVSMGSSTPASVSGSGVVSITNTTASTSPTTGALLVSGGVGINGDLNVQGSFTPSNITTTNLTTTSGTQLIREGGNLTIGANNLAGTVSIGSSTAAIFSAVGSLNIQSLTSSTTTSTGALIVSGGVGIGGNLNVGGSSGLNSLTVGSGTPTTISSVGIVNIPNTTSATSTTSGALIVAGGVGIGGNLHVGGSLTTTSFNPSSITTTNVNSTSGSTLASGGGNLTIGGNNNTGIMIAGAATAFKVDLSNGTTYVQNADDATATAGTGALIVSGGLRVAKQLRVGTDLTVSGTLSAGTFSPSSITTTNVNSTSGSTLASSGGNLTIGGNNTTGIMTAGQATAFKVNLNDGTTYVQNADDATTTEGTGSLIVSGGLRVAKQLRVGTDLTVSGTLSAGTFSPSSITTTNVNSTSGSTLASSGGNLTIGGNNTTGIMTAGQATAFKVNLNDGTTYVQNTDDATATAGTGALIVSGGARVAKQLRVTGNTNITGNLIVGGTITPTSLTTRVIRSGTVNFPSPNTQNAWNVGAAVSYASSSVTVGVASASSTGTTVLAGAVTSVTSTGATVELYTTATTTRTVSYIIV